ncbi:hypothetical protein [Hyphomonas sp.]|uniref:hypothetical protein n=1 Tax=Hyphomonas sp. TaxID=87 RepID=UPI00391ADBB5
MIRIVLLLLLASLMTGLAGTARAQGNEPLTAEVMRAELFGIRMSGIVVGYGISWNECIEPGGRTLYEIEDRVLEGVLEITDEAQACFTYPGTGTSCFRGQRSPRGYLFRSVDDGTLFHATKIERGVRRCIASDLVG